MENLKKYKNAKAYLKELQQQKLEYIINTVIEKSDITNDDLMTRTKKINICDARRKIIYLAKITFNMNGIILAERLKLDQEWVTTSLYTAFAIMQVDKEYRKEMQDLVFALDQNQNLN